MGLGLDRRLGVEGVVEAVGGCGRGDELGDALGAGRRGRIGVEVRLGEQLGGKQRRRDVPSGGRAEQGRPKARRDKGRQAAPASEGAVSPASDRRPRPTFGNRRAGRRSRREAVVLWMRFTREDRSVGE